MMLENVQCQNLNMKIIKKISIRKKHNIICYDSANKIYIIDFHEICLHLDMTLSKYGLLRKIS